MVAGPEGEHGRRPPCEAEVGASISAAGAVAQCRREDGEKRGFSLPQDSRMFSSVAADAADGEAIC